MNPSIRPFNNMIQKEHGFRWPAILLSSSRGYWNGRISLGNMTEFEVFFAFLPGDDGFFLGVMGYGCYRFSKSYKRAEYVNEKLKIGLTDAKNLADFMNAILQVKCNEQGIYDDEYCKGFDD